MTILSIEKITKKMTFFVNLFIFISIYYELVSVENLNQNILKNKINYVSASGNDSSGNGSLEKPYRMISFALENANRGDELYLEDPLNSLQAFTMRP